MARSAQESASSGGLWPTAALWAAAAACAVVVWRDWCAAPAIAWNPPRLAPTYALAHGMSPYTDPATHAPILGWIYGPVLPLLLLPVTMLPSLAAAMTAALAVQTVAVLAPIGVLARAAGLDWRAAAFAVVLATALLSADATMAHVWRGLHVDGVALGLSTMALACVLAQRERRTAGALAAAAAILTKQLALPIVLPVLLVVATRDGSGAAVRHALRICVCLAAAGIVVVLAFGAAPLVFGMWTVPSHHRILGMTPVRVYLSMWLASLGPAVVTLAAALACHGRRFRPSRIETALLVATVVFVPATVPVLAKAGGLLNNFYAPYFWTAFCVLVVTRGIVAGDAPRRLRAAVSVALLAAAPAVTWTTRPSDPPPAWRPSSLQDDLVRIAHRLDGAAWLPWNPLIGLAAYGRLFPFEDGLRSLDLAGMRPPAAAISAQVPADVRYALCTPGTACVPPEFPEFAATGMVEYGHRVYRRPPP